jgi:predicted permease
MTALDRLRSFWRHAVRRAEMERDMADELRFHLERRAADLVARDGVSPDEAARLARLEFGSIERYKEEARQSVGLRLLDELRSDVRYAVRALRGSGGFTAAALATLALGIGANTAVFSVVDPLLLQDLPVPDPQALVVFDWLRSPQSMVARYSGYGRPAAAPGLGVRTSFSALTVDAFREHTSTLSHVFAFSPTGPLTIDRQPEPASGLFVSGDYFAGLGIDAAVGRALSRGDDRPQAEPAAVISHRFWQRRFGGDRRVVGTKVEINHLPVAIVGITAAGFDGPRMGESTDVVLPIAMAARLAPSGHGRPVSTWWLQMMGRLQPGVSRERALAELQTTFAATVRESWARRPADTPDPQRREMPQLRVRPGAQGPDGPRLDARALLAPVLAIVAAILLTGCVNLATLLLVRASSRRQQIILRVTLGASRWRVMRQLLTEAVLLALLGGVGGTILAWWAKDFLRWLPLHDAPIVDARIDPRVLAFTAALSTLTALLFGLAPALRATRPDLAPSLRVTGERAATRRGITTQVLLVGQVAISLVLLVGAGLLVRSLHNLSRVDLGFDADNVLVFRVDPVAANPGARVDPAAPIDPATRDDASRIFDGYDRIMAAIEAVPGVQSTTMSAMPLVARAEWEEPVRADGAGAPTNVFIQAVRWNFLETMGIPLLAGRSQAPTDTTDHPRVAVINETMARRLFGDRAPIGRVFRFVNGPNRDAPIRVIGVARDAKYASLEQPAPPTFYLPHLQAPPSGMTVEVRTRPDPLSLAGAIRAAVGATDPTVRLVQVQTQRQQIAQTLGLPRTLATLMSVSGVIGLLLACVGLYGVVSYETTRRTREFGVRVALGARRGDVLRLAMRQTVVVVAVGASIGVGLALAGSRLMGSVLFGIGPADPVAVGAALTLLVGVALIASYVPARRAARLDPTTALRCE